MKSVRKLHSHQPLQDELQADGLHVGALRVVRGAAVAAQDLTGQHGSNKATIGGTLVGPGAGDSGDWAVFPPGGIVGQRSPMCKACLQSCRNGFGFGTIPLEPGSCRDICIQFGDAGYGGCSASDFPPDIAG